MGWNQYRESPWPSASEYSMAPFLSGPCLLRSWLDSFPPLLISKIEDWQSRWIGKAANAPKTEESELTGPNGLGRFSNPRL
jgi:hypothetical protein